MARCATIRAREQEIVVGASKRSQSAGQRASAMISGSLAATRTCALAITSSKNRRGAVKNGPIFLGNRAQRWTGNPDAFQPDLAMSLNDLGAMLTEMAQYKAGLTTMQEALDLI